METGINTAFDLIDLTKLRNDAQFVDIDGSDLAVVVIDTGIVARNPDLSDNFRAFLDFTELEDPVLITDPIQTYDFDGQGTHVSGTIGSSNPDIGIATDVDLISLKVADNPSSVDVDAIERALQWVIDNYQQYNITAVNIALVDEDNQHYSSESQARNHPLRNEVEQLEQLGITVVSAAGDAYQERQSQNLPAPAIFSTLAVGGVWKDDVGRPEDEEHQTPRADRILYFSQRLDASNMILAPGALINSTTNSIVPGETLELRAGTAMASAHLSGAVALMQEASLEFGGRLLLPDEVASILRSTAVQIFDGIQEQQDDVTNTFTNYPRLNIYNAIVATQQLGYTEITQYGASYTDLIRRFGYNLEALAQHYQDNGRQEGRSRDTFDEWSYLASNPSLINSLNSNNLATAAARQYIEQGFGAGLSTDSFDEYSYLASNTFLIGSVSPTDAARDYVETGFANNRLIDNFDEYNYLASNRDLISIISPTDAARNYVETGFFEERSLDNFDEISYLASHRDLIAIISPANATQHYVQYGFSEGRSLDTFDEFSYLASNRDLIGIISRANATQHYVQYGFSEGRPVDNFDEFSYLASNRDLIGVVSPTNTIQHYVRYGFSEGRPVDNFDEYSYLASNTFLIGMVSPNNAAQDYVLNGFIAVRSLDNFDEFRYLASNTDLIGRVTINDATQHYAQYGYFEGRRTDVFNPVQYLASYDDLINRYAYNLQAATEHYLQYGYAEGRNIYLFPSDRYIASHGDLIRSIGYDLDKGAQHYIQYGAAENRSTNLFDPVVYLSRYTDLQSVFGNDLFKATQHYIQYGFYEIEAGVR